MSRNKGLVTISNNFEPRIAQPLDSRLVANTVSDLTNPSYWESSDSNTYLYQGIAVAVWNDNNPVNNGVYILKDNDFEKINNWIKVGSEEYGNGLIFSNGEVSISLTQSSGLTFSNSDLVVNVDDDTIKINQNGKIQVSGNSVYQSADSLVTNGDKESTGISIQYTPKSFSSVKVFVNGQALLLGDLTTDFYFSSDGGTTAKDLKDIVSGDILYFNGGQVGWNLSTTDRIILVYEADIV